jgi:hypothetical protein
VLPPNPILPAISLSRGVVLRFSATATPPQPVAPTTLAPAAATTSATTTTPTAATCRAVMSFVDSNGLPLMFAGTDDDNDWKPGMKSKTVKLATNTFASVRLDGNALVSQVGQRVLVRPILTLTDTLTPNSCLPSAELFDRVTGKSTVLWQGR